MFIECIHIHHQSLQRVSSKQYTAQYNYIYTYISNGCISLKYLQLFFIDLILRISNGYIVNELVIKLEILNEIEREWINSKLEWHSGLCL